MYAFLTHINPAQNKNRWYFISIQPGIIDACVVYRSWGRRDSDSQQILVRPFEPDEAIKLARKIVREKVRKGYTIAHCSAELRPEENHMLPIKRTPSEIDQLHGDAIEASLAPTAYPGESYEQGVYDTLMWLFGESNEYPLPENYEVDDE